MLADGTTTLWQAVSPKTADAILRDNGRVLHPSCQGDAFALLKLNPELARQMAETVWARGMVQQRWWKSWSRHWPWRPTPWSRLPMSITGSFGYRLQVCRYCPGRWSDRPGWCSN